MSVRTPLCDLLGIDVPIAAFSHCREVVAAVSNGGGIGVFGAARFDPDELHRLEDDRRGDVRHHCADVRS